MRLFARCALLVTLIPSLAFTLPTGAAFAADTDGTTPQTETPQSAESALATSASVADSTQSTPAGPDQGTTDPGDSSATSEDGSTNVEAPSEWSTTPPLRPYDPARFVCWGDSLSTLLCGTQWGKARSYFDVAFDGSRAVVDHGIGSQTSTDIAMRAGIGELLITFPGDTIPSTTDPVPVTVKATSPLSRIFVSWTYVEGVAGFLQRDESLVGHWTFARAAAGDPVAIAPSTPVTIDDSLDIAQEGFVWAGRNNPDDPEATLRDVRSIVDRHAAISSAPMWVVSQTSGVGEGKATALGKKRSALNSALAARYGDRYIPLDEYMSNNALADLGIVPNAEDRLAMAQGLIPVRLRTADGYHFNDLGKRAVASYIASLVRGGSYSYLTGFSPQADVLVRANTDGRVTIIGWGFEKSDMGANLPVRLTVDGSTRATTIANLGSGYLGAYGVWGNHAFAAQVDLEPGQHRVCATFGNLYAGSDTELCRSVEVPRASNGAASSPQGDFTVLHPDGADYYLVIGWAFDHSDLWSPIDVDVWADGSYRRRLSAGLDSPYLYPYGVPGRHAFFTAIPAENGRHTVCVNAIDHSPGRNVGLGCRDIVVWSPPQDPQGSAEPSFTEDSLTISGYAYDHSNLYQPIRIAVFQGSTLIASTTANGAVPSLAPYGVPGTHGYSLTTRLSPEAQGDVCVLALNIGQGAHTWLNCWKASGSPISPLVSISAEEEPTGGIRVDGWAIDLSFHAQSLSALALVDGFPIGAVTASLERPELGWMFGWDGRHGFSFDVAADPSLPHTICLSVGNIGTASPPTASCTRYSPRLS